MAGSEQLRPSANAPLACGLLLLQSVRQGRHRLGQCWNRQAHALAYTSRLQPSGTARNLWEVLLFRKDFCQRSDTIGVAGGHLSHQLASGSAPRSRRTRHG